jgi:hypothetical protein
MFVSSHVGGQFFGRIWELRRVGSARGVIIMTASVSELDDEIAAARHHHLEHRVPDAVRIADPASHPQAAGTPRGCARLLATAADQHRTTGCHPQNQL